MEPPGRGAAAPVWEIDIERRLGHGSRPFHLCVAWRSNARRLALLGTSGAGKSQTLKAIAGLARPDRGRVVLEGRALFDSAAGVDVPPQRRRLSYLFQDYALFPHLTVRQNVAFALSGGWFNPRRAFEPDEVGRWLHAFAIADLADHYPAQLSGGQRQRTALARALVARPRALLLDEPFAALDPKLRRTLRDELLALLERIELPVLLVTHDEDDIDVLGAETIVIEDGRVVTPCRAPGAAAVRPAGADAARASRGPRA